MPENLKLSCQPSRSEVKGLTGQVIIIHKGHGVERSYSFLNLYQPLIELLMQLAFLSL